VGDVNPTGRLPISIPNKDNEVGFTPEQYPGVDGTSHYTEELLVGYRWYDAHEVAPLYPFGHGLSYTTFAYSALTLNASAMTIGCDVENSGKVAGAEVVQLYLSFPKSAKEPPQQLKGFMKTDFITPGSKVHVTFNVTQRDISIWDEAVHSWAPQKGTFGVRIGASSRNILLTGTLDL